MCVCFDDDDDDDDDDDKYTICQGNDWLWLLFSGSDNDFFIRAFRPSFICCA